MKVGINARTFAVDQPGGSVQVGIHATRELLRRESVDLTLFGHKSIGTHFDAPCIDDTLYGARSKLFGMAWERTVLPLRAWRRDIDVLFAPNTNGPPFATPFATVIYVHDVNAERGYSSDAYRRLKSFVVPRTIEYADMIVTVSEFSKSEIIDVYDIAPSGVQVVPNGVDELFRSDTPGSSMDLPNEYILYVGAMNPRKNPSGVLEAFRALKTETTLPHQLVIIGPDNNRLFEDFEIQNSDEVVTPGYVSKDELKYAYENASLFVFPSLYEGFGLPPLEAMACGTPVVASNTGALPEVLGDAAYYINPENPREIADGMRQVLTDNGLGAELVEEGAEHVQRYSWESAAADLLEIFRRVR